MKLAESLAIFTSLGWHEAPVTDALTLPLGTPEQQKQALAGLRSGDWGRGGRTKENPRYHWISYVEGHETMLTYFAIRLGVSIPRTLELLRGEHTDTNVAVILSRGEEFATTLVKRAARMQDDRFNIAHTIVKVGLEVDCTDDLRYLHLWVAQVREHPELAHTRFFEHAHATLGLATRAIADLVSHAYSTQIITRDQALELGLYGLRLSARPSDRNQWATFLAKELAITDAELIHHKGTILGALSTGDATPIELLGLPLLAHLEGQEFIETALACLYAKTAQAQLKTLSLIEGRELDTTLLTRVAELAASTSAKVAKKAAALTPPPLVEEKPPADLWRDTPPVWHMPRFDRPPATVAALVAELPRISIDRSRWETFVDEHAERFLAGLVELAANNPAAARQAISRADEHIFNGLLHKWAHGQEITVDERHTLDRIHCVMAVLGKIPWMLSEPSFADLSISLPDLCARLARYLESGAAIMIADFLLALYRLRITDNFTTVPEFPLPLEHVDGTRIDATAGDVLRGYLDDPVLDRGIYLHNGVHPRYRHEVVALPESLTSVPGLYPKDFATHNISLDAGSFPTFGDSVLLDVGRGLVPQSAVRATNRAEPLSQAAATNLLSVPDTTAAVVAWQRGLLIPGRVDLEYLDWQPVVTHIADLVGTTCELAEQGLLSVVWPLWDALLVYAVAQKRLPSGIVDVVRAMGEYCHCVPASQRDCPGLRAFAAKSGKSESVVKARELVEKL
ncbi:MAG: hypothetical protein Q4D85_09765 [Corynebacterium sp.]|uniref:hypothetical protein n=1 Tax=Corynebacterium sp. TaxID=1720 RepID=UPI0026DC44C0|nr:hypothetical protein [Corynebacterium sp.]MDO5099029.1 hypothetical protein [Corynebacterium sp.]